MLVPRRAVITLGILDKFSTSPVPEDAKIVKPISMSFPDAMGEIVNGKKITRVEWNDTQEYGMLKDGFLLIHTKGQDHRWIVSEADMVAIDWVVI